MNEKFSLGFKVGVAVIVLSFVAAAGALYYISSSLEYAVQKIGFDRTTLQSRILAVSQLAELKQAAGSAETYKKTLDTILPDQNKLFDFPRWIDNLAGNYNLTDRFSFQGDQVASEAGNPGYVGFSIDMDGSVDNILAFMKNLEKLQESQFLVAIDGFDVNQSGNNYHANFHGRVFFK